MLLPIIKLNNHVQVTCDINENQYKRLERMGIKTGDIIEQGNNSYKVSSLVKYMLFLEIASN